MEGYNPETFYKKFNMYINEDPYGIQQRALNIAATGDLNATKYLANKMAKAHLIEPYSIAKENGQTEIADYLLNLYEKEVDLMWE